MNKGLKLYGFKIVFIQSDLPKRNTDLMNKGLKP